MSYPCVKCGKSVPDYLFLCDECADTIIKEEIRKEEEVSNCELKKEEIN